MRRILLLNILLFITGILTLQAQIRPIPNNPYGDSMDEYGNIIDKYGNQVDPSMRPTIDSTEVDYENIPPKLYMWHISEDLGNVNIIPADTLRLNFQNTNLTGGMNGEYNYLANLGTPRMSRIFFNRRDNEPSIFIEPYSSFFQRPNEVFFTNSNVPFANLSYYKAGNKINGEERFKAYFSVNVNKALAFGFDIDYLYGRGYYYNSNTSFFKALPFISYMGDKYEASFMYNYNYLKANQNGGITDDRYITNPDDVSSGSVESTNIPTLLSSATSRLADSYVFFTQRYKMGFHRELPQAEEDSLPPRKEFVPVTSLIHTAKVEWSNYKFASNDQLNDYYQNTFIEPGSRLINDSTSFISVKNTVGISLLEGFNKYAKMGLTAFASYKFSKYNLMNSDSTTVSHFTENEFFVGGELSKKEGELLHYNAFGEVGLLGKGIGQFDVKGNIDFNIPMWKDVTRLTARARISNLLPNFYMRHYHSKHFYWDFPDMDKEFRTRIEGELNIGRTKTLLKAGVENIKKYTYFNQNAVPEQHGGNIQVLSATLKQDFKLGILHWDNDVTWQKSSNNDVLPLPDITLYSNLYIDFKLAKDVLSLQVGADLRYFTAYYAPAFMPNTGQFYVQPENDKVKIGNYPIVNAYINIHLKRTRIFVMMDHVNQGLGKANYFLAPHYPINPRLFKFGLSWNFYN